MYPKSMLLQHDPRACFPSAEDLPDSSELGLGIGREIGIYQGIKREWLYWYDEQGKRYLTFEEELRSAQERNRQLEKH